MKTRLTDDHEAMMRAHAKRNPGFRRASLLGAIEELLAGDRYVACAKLRRLTLATMGFPAMAEATGIHEKSLARMLGPKGNPTTDNLLAIIRVLAAREKVRFEIRQAKPGKAA